MNTRETIRELKESLKQEGVATRRLPKWVGDLLKRHRGKASFDSADDSWTIDFPSPDLADTFIKEAGAKFSRLFADIEQDGAVIYALV